MMARLQANTEFFLGYEGRDSAVTHRISQRCGPPPQRSSRASAATRRANHRSRPRSPNGWASTQSCCPVATEVPVRTPTDKRSSCGSCLPQADPDGTTTRPWPRGSMGTEVHHVGGRVAGASAVLVTDDQGPRRVDVVRPADQRRSRWKFHPYLGMQG